VIAESRLCTHEQKSSFLWKRCEVLGIIVEMTKKPQRAQLPKVQVKVSKAAFDKVLGKLIKAKPMKRA